ncbi:sushi, von Willebrand factor type A, EGF and pentraxin domain-containing protein 1-like isoform X2 [Patiria miniata]|uniref:Uncharacterized protein n=1 Tax=Patiria miniata TaxID=46514 RepID=A0A914A3A2_PATMI|nr:sushi, von Willebrand factor type A, EGF and pentraxin domain-containing protein 1-like isoform X2 [Patiria miniata]
MPSQSKSVLACLVVMVLAFLTLKCQSSSASACTSIPTFSNATCTLLDLSTEVYAVCSCDPGYEPEGPASVAVLRCNDTDSWEGDGPACTLIECPDPIVPAWSSLDGPTIAGYYPGSTVSYTCQASYAAVGNSTQTCQADGTWSGLDLYCRPSCPTGGLPNENHCYFIKEDLFHDWDNARLACESDGYALAKVESASQQDFLKTELHARGSALEYWIGGHEARPWVWEHSKKFPEFLPWAPGEPNNQGGEDCLQLSSYSDSSGTPHNYRWNDQSCDDLSYAICQFASPCPISALAAYNQYDYDSHCLVFVDALMSWYSARDDCSLQGGWLVEVVNQATQEFLVETLLRDFSSGVLSHWWIGAIINNTVTERAWRWTDDVLITNLFWKPNEPNGLDQSCISMLSLDDFEWDDQYCYHLLYRVCRYDLQNTTCGDPGWPLHGQRSGNSSNTNGVVQYTCDEGYQLKGPGSRVCLASGDWSGEEPSCNIISCSDPIIPNSNVTVLSSEFRGVAILSCAEGYKVEGDPVIQCGSNASWIPTTNCTIITCGEPAIIPNGNATVLSYEYQGTAMLSCEEGYEMEGESNISCLSNTSWSSTNFTCNVISCGEPPTIPNGNVTVLSYEYQGTTILSCAEGYEMEGESNISCLSNSTWSSTDFTCNIVRCGEPPTIPNANVSVLSYEYQGAAILSCEEGYEMEGSNAIFCMSNASWSSTNFTCNIISCGKPPTIPNGNVTVLSYEYQGVATFSCAEGYEMEGESSISCLSNTSWSSTNFTCNIVYCGEPPTIPNADVSVMSYEYLGAAILSCAEGYEMEGMDTIVCLSKASWSSTNFTCNIVSCGKPPTIPNGNITVLSHEYQGVAIFSCAEGYEMEGESNISCLSNSTWSSTNFTCNIVNCSGPPAIPNGNVTVVSYEYQGAAILSCANGYEMEGMDTIFCLSNALWSSTNFTCNIISCGEPPTILNGNTTVVSYEYQGAAILSCAEGYEVEGEDVIFCLSNGSWSSVNSTCKMLATTESFLLPSTMGDTTTQIMWTAAGGDPTTLSQATVSKSTTTSFVSTTEESTTAESTTADSTTVDSTTVDSTTADSTTVDSTTADSTTAKSTTADSTTAESTTADSTTSHSTTADSTTVDSTTVDSTIADSTTAKSTTADSTKAESTTADSTTAESTTADSTTAHSTTAESTTAHSTTTNSSTTDFTTTAESTTFESTTDESTTVESTTSEMTTVATSPQTTQPQSSIRATPLTFIHTSPTDNQQVLTHGSTSSTNSENPSTPDSTDIASTTALVDSTKSQTTPRVTSSTVTYFSSSTSLSTTEADKKPTSAPLTDFETFMLIIVICLPTFLILFASVVYLVFVCKNKRSGKKIHPMETDEMMSQLSADVMKNPQSQEDHQSARTVLQTEGAVSRSVRPPTGGALPEVRFSRSHLSNDGSSVASSRIKSKTNSARRGRSGTVKTAWSEESSLPVSKASKAYVEDFV